MQQYVIINQLMEYCITKEEEDPLGCICFCLDTHCIKY